MTFRYIAYNEQRTLVEGVIDAATENLAEAALAQSGYRVVSLKAARPRLSLEQAFPSLFRVKAQHLIVFSRQLATLLGSGIPMLTALELLREQVPSRALKSSISAIIEELQGGSSLGLALARQPQVFSRMYCRMVEVGERTSGLEGVLRQLADYMEKERAVSKKVGGALIYPALMVLMTVGVVGLLITVVLPPIIDLFAGLKVELPWTTRLLLTGANFLIANKLQVLLVAAALVAFAVWYLRTPAGRWRFQLWLLKAPLFGPVILQRQMSRLCRTMSMLVQAGLPMPEIMELLRQTTANEVIRQALDDIRVDLIQGHGLAKPMSANRLFPRMMVQMVMLGEETGTLETNLLAMAESYESEVDSRVSSLVSMIEPMMTLGIGLMVGFIALSVIMPLYSIMGSIK